MCIASNYFTNLFIKLLTYYIRLEMDNKYVSNKQYNMTIVNTFNFQTNLEVVRQCGILLTNNNQLNKVSTLHT